VGDRGGNSRVFISALFKRASHYPAGGQLGRRLVRITSLQREEKSLNLGRLITPSWQVSKPFRCIPMIDLRGARKKSPTINIIWDTRKQEVSFYVLVPTSSSDFPAQMMFGPGCGFFLPPIQGRNGEFLVVPLAFKWARMKGDPLTCTADTNEIINTAINQWNRAGLGEDMRILHSGIVIFYQPDR
jgi:hypothetical protein